MSEPLLHLVTIEQWRAAVAAGVLAPPSLAQVGFVHLSTPEQVHLPASRMFPGRPDLWLLVLDPDRLGVEVRYEPGLPTDPASMLFPHAYGSIPLGAVTAVLPYRPGPDGRFEPPRLPRQSPAGRLSTLEPSLLRRAATQELPVVGGTAVLTDAYPASYQHNALLIDGEVDTAQVIAETDRVLGGAGLRHRRARLAGDHLATTAAGLARRGWAVEQLIGMAAPVGEPIEPVPGAGWAEQVARVRLTSFWAANWRRTHPGITAPEIAQLAARYSAEEPVVDLRYLAVFARFVPVAACVLKIDGGTALIDAVATDPAHRRRGHGDALLRTARALAAAAGCDLLVLQAEADGWPRQWYARRGFTEVTRSWEATRVLPAL
ncbi:GNAT family N-acetyltransferase [Pseudonocardia humida]|nr:GNAT family N-acetyltransferase [Pseudonocardia humida]